MIAFRVKTEPEAPALEFGFDFDVKADAPYKLIMPRLLVTLVTESTQVGATNGFEVFQRFTQKLDPPRADSAFHFANEIRGLGGQGLQLDCPIRQVPRLQDP